MYRPHQLIIKVREIRKSIIPFCCGEGAPIKWSRWTSG